MAPLQQAAGLPCLLLQVVSKPGATIDDSEMIDGLVLDLKAGKGAALNSLALSRNSAALMLDTQPWPHPKAGIFLPHPACSAAIAYCPLKRAVLLDPSCQAGRSCCRHAGLCPRPSAALPLLCPTPDCPLCPAPRCSQGRGRPHAHGERQDCAHPVPGTLLAEGHSWAQHAPRLAAVSSVLGARCVLGRMSTLPLADRI